MKMSSYAMSRLNVAPVPVRMNPTRISLRARASRMNLSYFSYATGTKSMKAERNIPATATNIANPVRPAGTLKGQSGHNIGYSEARHAHGPTFHFAWKLATPAKHAIARKLKKIWEAWSTMVGFDTII